MEMRKIVPCLWFNDGEAEEAVHFYTGIFKDSKIGKILRYGPEAAKQLGVSPDMVLTVEFTLNGQNFVALNGAGEMKFHFTEAVSFQVFCETQKELNHYWGKLGAGGDPKAQVCGWLKDKYGLSWQIVPTVLPKLLTDPDAEKAARVMRSMMQMKKLDIAALERAYRGLE
ncbi:MAG TPA: VOC family protein [Gammaproteobacteria bacterium]|nr:VOC family protein [Gammaproteobacteria bacterium]